MSQSARPPDDIRHFLVAHKHGKLASVWVFDDADEAMRTYEEMKMSVSSPMTPIHRGKRIHLYRAEKGLHTYPGVHLWLGRRLGRWLRWLPNVHDSHMKVWR